MQREQERLGSRLEAAGLKDFIARSEWLFAHRTRDERLAWERKWAALGLVDPAPRSGRVPPKAPCARCGVSRTVHSGRANVLCSDCRFVLTSAEIAVWVGAA